VTTLPHSSIMGSFDFAVRFASESPASLRMTDWLNCRAAFNVYATATCRRDSRQDARRYKSRLLAAARMTTSLLWQITNFESMKAAVTALPENSSPPSTPARAAACTKRVLKSGMKHGRDVAATA